MNLTNLRQSFLKNRWRVVVAVIALFVVGFGIEWYYRHYINPPVPEEAKIPALTISEETATIRGKVYLSALSSIESPEELAVYQADALGTSFTESEMVDLAARFGFTGEPTRLSLQDGREDFLFFGENTTLSITPQPRMLSYTVDSTGGEGSVYGQTVAIEKAEEFINAKGLAAAEMASFAVHYWDYGGNVYVEAESAGDADFVEVEFVSLVNELPLVGKATMSASANVIFDRTGEVTSLAFTFLDTSFTQSKTVKLRSYAEATEALLEEGLVIWTRKPGDMAGWAASPSHLYSFSPQSVQLVYYQSEESNLLHPVYFFKGEGIAVGGDSVKANVYLSAVSPKYIKK